MVTCPAYSLGGTYDIYIHKEGYNLLGRYKIWLPLLHDLNGRRVLGEVAYQVQYINVGLIIYFSYSTQVQKPPVLSCPKKDLSPVAAGVWAGQSNDAHSEVEDLNSISPNPPAFSLILTSTSGISY